MWGWLMFGGVVLVVAALLGWRNANHDYTAGSGLFKNSDDNLEKEKHMDASDFNYYNKTGKQK